jgi:DNA-3-methyladenine glycosylase II
VEKHYLDGKEAEKSQIIAIGEAWKPWRTVATWYLWRSLDPFPVEY